jgi:hypothetical protein
MYQIPAWFDDFIAPGCDRLEFIRKFLEQYGVATSVVPIGQKRHIFVNFPLSSYSPMFRMKTVLVHYDRVEGSPGANDNSAAVLQVMDLAVRLKSYRGVHNVRIFFTDGEELGSSGGVTEQGAYALAELFKKLRITDNDVFVFDCCGRGTVPVIAKTVLSETVPASFAKKMHELTVRTSSMIRQASPGKWFLLPVSYSDNAGFLACGIPAVVITLLPREEVGTYLQELMRTKNLEAAVMNRAKESSAGRDELPDFMYREKMPFTWRLFHTEYDTKANLTPESFVLMERILNSLVALKTMA